MAPSTALTTPLLLREALEARPLPTLSAMPLKDVLRLIRSQNVGPVTFFHLIRRFGNAAEALEHLPELARRGGGKAPSIPYATADAESEIAAVEQFGARMVRYGEPDYPPLLLHIPDPPPVITVRGNAQAWGGRPCLGVVGARNASAGGTALAQRLARELSKAGLTIVSGLARGIDSFAHRGAMPDTVAVIAGGIDNIYPPENAKLTAEIASGGAIISEQPFGTLPFAGSFPGRNRIIAGMSLGTLVVEATQKSGSLITARFAADFGREIFAVPGSPLDPRSGGPNALIRQGAHLVETAADVLEALPSFAPKLMENTPADAYFAGPVPEFSEAEMAKAQAILLEKLGITPIFVDELLVQCQLTGGLLFTVLMELELAGRIQRLPGNKICLRADV